MTPQTKDNLRELRGTISKLIKHKAEDFIGAPERLYSFSKVEEEIRTVFSLLGKIMKLDLEHYPPENMTHLNVKVDQVCKHLIKIRTFDLSRKDASIEHDGLISAFISTYDEALPRIIQAIAFDDVVRGNKSTSDYIRDIEQSVLSVERDSEKFKKLIETHTNTANKTIEAFGMHKYAEIFGKESDSFKTSSASWFKWSIVSLVVTILFGSIFLFITKDFSDKLDIIQFTVTKIVILTACFYGVNICFKNYKAHKHNEILNKHRHNALVTFEAFTAGKEDEQTKNAILLAATQTIFGNQQTGYSNTDSADSDVPTRIIEILKTSPPK